jgi:lysophospholipase L1-like esterase
MIFRNNTPFSNAALALLFFGSLAVKADNVVPPKNYLMAAMGDSISAGFLAATDLDWFNSASLTIPQEAEDFLAAVEAVSGLDAAATTFNWEGTLAHIFETRTTKSWSTGLELDSHYVRLMKAVHQVEPTSSVFSMNVALSGGETSDLYDQADAIVKEMNTGRYAALKYVTLLIGNNDACKNRDPNLMKIDLHNIFQILSTIKQTEPIRVLMSGIPRIPDVGEMDVDSSKTIFKYSCSAFRRSITRMCLPLTEWSKEAQYIDLIQYTQGVNETLSEAADDANTNFKNLDVQFSDALFDNPITRDNLAIDCFHPNATSQAKIAEDLWQAQPWFKAP